MRRLGAALAACLLVGLTGCAGFVGRVQMGQDLREALDDSALEVVEYTEAAGPLLREYHPDGWRLATAGEDLRATILELRAWVDRVWPQGPPDRD